MSGKAKPETPRWRRKAAPLAPQLVLSKRQHTRLTRQVAAQLGVPAPAGQPAGKQASPVSKFRYQLVPVWWGIAVLAIGAGSHLTGHVFAGVTAGLLAGATIHLSTRRLKGTSRKLATGMASLTAVWVPLLALAGLTRPWPPVLFACWLAVAVPWWKHYRWRRQDIKPAAPSLTDADIWNKLAARRKWSGTLANCRDIPNGRQWDILLDGSETDIGEVMSQPRKIAAAWGKSMTECYAEPSRDDIESRGTLTILRRGTLQAVREWSGAGISPETGTATIGRFADGSPAHMKFFTPRFGTRHALISGTSGSGKSEALNLLLFIAIECGYIVPVVLDPQEGQSLPYWRDRCLYAPGRDECLQMLRGLHAGMLDRSRYLASLRWDDDGVAMKGMGFFDHVLTGLPIILIIFDEAHMLLAGQKQANRDAVELTLEIGRLGRKTGTALWLGTQLPSLSDLGGEQALRDMLRGGNVVSFRTANTVATGMLGLQKDPSLIQPYFADGKETVGVGYVVGPDNRSGAPMRTDLVPKAIKRREPAVPALDDRFAAAMDRAMAMGGVQFPLTPPAPLTAVPDDEPSAPGRSCADAVLAVLTGELDRGDIIARAGKLATGDLESGGWGRRKPYSVRAVSDALGALAADGRVVKTGRGAYDRAR